MWMLMMTTPNAIGKSSAISWHDVKLARCWVHLSDTKLRAVDKSTYDNRLNNLILISRTIHNVSAYADFLA